MGLGTESRGPASRGSRRQIGLVVFAVIAAVLIMEVAYGGADLGSALLYLGYHLAFSLVPGWLLYRAISSQPGGAIRQIAMGWSLGIVLAIFAFMLTAAVGARGAFLAYPAIVAIAAVLILRRRRSGRGGEAPVVPAGFRWALVLLAMTGVAVFAIGSFASTILPGDETVSYYQDYSYHLAVAGEAKNHWPMTDPNISGEPAPSQNFTEIHMAAAAQATGLDLPLIFFRLFGPPLIVLIVLQFVVAGRSLAGSAYAGLIAAAIALLIGELHLTTDAAVVPFPFLGVFFTFMSISPGFLLGLGIFLPLITLIGERMVGRPSGLGDWLLILILAAGVANVKVVALPLLVGSCLAFAAWSRLSHKRVPKAAWYATAISAGVLGAFYLLQYGGQSSGLAVGPLASFDLMPGVIIIKDGLRDFLPSFPGQDGALAAAGVLIGCLGLLSAQLAGLPWLHRRGEWRLTPEQAWLSSLLAVGIVALFALEAPGSGNHLYFVFYGLVGGYLLSAQGLYTGWRRRPELAGKGRRILLLGAGFVIVIAGVMAAPSLLDLFSGPDQDAQRYAFLYGGLLLALGLLYLLARRIGGGNRWPAAALCTGAVLVVGALGTPINYLKPALTTARVEPTAGNRVTPELYGALTWLRDSTPVDAVVAVNSDNRYQFDYSAFAERRIFLEGWGYSQRAFAAGTAEVASGAINPFEDRLALNEAAFELGDDEALATMARDFDVRYLIIDEINGYPVDLDDLRGAGEIVYEAPGVTIIQLSEM